MATTRHHWLTALGFTAVLFLLVSLAVAGAVDHFVPVMLGCVAVSVATFYTLFPGSRFFTIAFANFLAVYACVFVYFVEANFANADVAAVLAGFALPLVAFIAGAWWRRREIHAIIAADRMDKPRNFAHVLLWLIPVFAIGVISFLVPAWKFGAAGYDYAILAAMAAIALIVLFVSRDVTTFLLDTGLLFESFFERIAALFVPAFAFFTFYSLLVIVFGAIYRIIDHLSPDAMFKINGAVRHITFPEALYFSVVTLSTVGYGDVVPVTSLTRIIVALQIVCGVLLLLFGFSEIIAFTRDRHGGRK